MNQKQFSWAIFWIFVGCAAIFTFAVCGFGGR